MKACVIFPHQLFKHHPCVDTAGLICISEDPLFFGDRIYPMRFHKKKLLLHRASMKHYEERLLARGKKLIYKKYEDQSAQQPVTKLFSDISALGANEIIFADPCDFILEKRINQAADKLNLKVTKTESPSFMTDRDFFKEIYGDSRTFLMAKFYVAQRKRMKILIDRNGKPTGGKWSFDEDNRKKIPKGFSVPHLPVLKSGKQVKVFANEINMSHPDNPGCTEGFNYPVDHKSAEAWFESFLKDRFLNFGEYEDAIVNKETFLFHSVLTPALNTGLVTPAYVVERAIDFAESNNIPLNSLEGFLRQIIGWREFIRLMYVEKGVQQRNSNFWGFSRRMPASFYEGTTGIVPFDSTVRKVIDNAYCHHIERLMILGNFMLLCEINPDEVYKWFMELFIDAYDWVMVPNVYGMSQFADGGLMATKPYISSSNYIRKMSNYPAGEWCKVWDGLYWRFIHNHLEFFRSNYRLSMMAVQVDRMDRIKLKQHIRTAEKFLETL